MFAVPANRGGRSQPRLGATTDRLADQPPFEEAELPRHLPERPFRVEIVDNYGHKAWTNPFLSGDVVPEVGGD